MKHLCVIGAGYVGLVTGTCLAELGNSIVCVDNNRAKIAMLRKKKIPIYEPGLERLVHKNMALGRLSFAHTIAEGMKEAEVVFIAVGTPPQPDGSADLSFVEDVSRQIAQHLSRYTLVVEKSTVPVETGLQVERTIARYNHREIPFDVASNPEFLREGTAIHDFLHPDRIVIGVRTRRAEQLLLDLYHPIKAPVVVTDMKSAEIIKHASNSFLATKISFINAVANICERVGADITKVAEGMGLDPRIGASCLSAGIGFGGFCLPKDLDSFLWIAKKIGYDFSMLQVVRAINEQQRLHFVRKVEEALWIVKDKTIAVWGLSFKSNTDDMRFAPSIEIIERLRALGAKIRAYDPAAMPRAKTIFGKRVTFCRDPYDAVQKADCLAILTEWEEFQKAQFSRVKKLLAHPVIVDGRNLFDPAKMKALGFEYKSMGR